MQIHGIAVLEHSARTYVIIVRMLTFGSLCPYVWVILKWPSFVLENTESRWLCKKLLRVSNHNHMSHSKSTSYRSFCWPISPSRFVIWNAKNIVYPFAKRIEHQHWTSVKKHITKFHVCSPRLHYVAGALKPRRDRLQTGSTIADNAQFHYPFVEATSTDNFTRATRMSVTSTSGHRDLTFCSFRSQTNMWTLGMHRHFASNILFLGYSFTRAFL